MSTAESDLKSVDRKPRAGSTPALGTNPNLTVSTTSINLALNLIRKYDGAKMVTPSTGLPRELKNRTLWFSKFVYSFFQSFRRAPRVGAGDALDCTAQQI